MQKGRPGLIIGSSSENEWPPRDFEIIPVHGTPTRTKWLLTPMYKRTASDNIIMWQVGFDGIDRLLMVKRIGEFGKYTHTSREVFPVAKRTMQEQALQMARHKYEVKFRDGYLPPGSDVPPLPKAMCGQPYDPNLIKSWPVSVEPKLDGIRCLMYFDRGVIRCFSRQNKEYRHLTHITEDLLNLFLFLPTNTMLDGELYNHNMSFNDLTSAVRTGLLKNGEIGVVSSRLREINYYIFDICVEEMMPYEERRALLKRTYELALKNREGKELPPYNFYLVPSYLARNPTEVKYYHDEMVKLGYEGLMIKKRANGVTDGPLLKESLYRRARCTNILKLKQFIDTEMVVTRVVEGEGTEEGTAILVVKIPWAEKELSVRCRGSFEQRREWFRNPKLVVGGLLTVRYQELTDDGVPRFPVGIAIRNYE